METSNPYYVENSIKFFDHLVYNEEAISKVYADKKPNLIPETLTFTNPLETNNMQFRMTFNKDGTFSGFFIHCLDISKSFHGEGIFLNKSDCLDKFDVRFLSVFLTEPGKALKSELTITMSQNRKFIIFEENILFSQKVQIDSSYKLTLDHTKMLYNILSQSSESSLSSDLFYKFEIVNSIQDFKDAHREFYFLSFLKNGDLKINQFTCSEDGFSSNISYGCFLEEENKFKISYINLDISKGTKLIEETIEKFENNKLKWNGFVFSPYEITINEKISSIIGDELQHLQKIPKTYLLELLMLSEMALETCSGTSFHNNEKDESFRYIIEKETWYNFYPNGLVKFFELELYKNYSLRRLGLGFYKRKNDEYKTHYIVYSLTEEINKTFIESPCRLIYEETFKAQGMKIKNISGKIFKALV
jgi:hypothetical protein